MNGVHDLGGMHGFGPVVPEPNEPVFHAAWERRTFALALATMGTRRVNVDEFRRVIERMPPAAYLATSYYEHWLHAIEALLVEKRIIGRDEIDARLHGDGGLSSELAPVVAAVADEADAALWSNPDTAAATRSSAVALRHNPKFKARFKPGERVIARNLNPEGHTRLPRYVRGHRGMIRHDWGAFVFPDTHACGAGANPQHCYAVEFSARELWGAEHPARERIYVDLWEAYLLPGEVAAARAKPPPAPALARQKIVKAAVVKTPKPQLKKLQAKKSPLKKSRVARPAPARVSPKRMPAAATRISKKASKRR
jgi:nitrile hydratase beta subunit